MHEMTDHQGLFSSGSGGDKNQDDATGPNNAEIVHHPCRNCRQDVPLVGMAGFCGRGHWICCECADIMYFDGRCPDRRCRTLMPLGLKQSAIETLPAQQPPGIPQAATILTAGGGGNPRPAYVPTVPPSPSPIAWQGAEPASKATPNSASPDEWHAKASEPRPPGIPQAAIMPTAGVDGNPSSALAPTVPPNPIILRGAAPTKIATPDFESFDEQRVTARADSRETRLCIDPPHKTRVTRSSSDRDRRSATRSDR